MHDTLYLRRRLRSIGLMLGVFILVGMGYELLDSGVLTQAGPITGFLVGLPVTLLEVLVPMHFMRRWPFAAIVLAKALLYILLILLVSLGVTFVHGLTHGLTLDDFYAEVFSKSTFSKVGIGFLAFACVVFFRQLNLLLGPGTLTRFVFGRYHRPRREQRIFMFLDLKDSTSIAESLDVDRYYALLNDFFHAVVGPVLATKAQIYQYVGDEVVLTWPMATGLRDANCIRVFYEIDTAVGRQASYYLARYGVVPGFKAGVHGGEVISAQIGDLKRDLVYNGDVLNTTARIQSECNRFDAQLLVSSELFERLVLPPGMEAESLGDVELKGKRLPIGLVRIGHRGAVPAWNLAATSETSGLAAHLA